MPLTHLLLLSSLRRYMCWHRPQRQGWQLFLTALKASRLLAVSTTLITFAASLQKAQGFSNPNMILCSLELCKSKANTIHKSMFIFLDKQSSRRVSAKRTTNEQNLRCFARAGQCCGNEYITLCWLCGIWAARMDGWLFFCG